MTSDERPLVVICKQFLKSGRNTDRATAVLANALNGRGFRVALLTLQPAGVPYAVTFDAGVVCYRVRAPRLLSRLRFLNRLFLRTAAGEWLLRRVFPFLDLTLKTSRKLRRRLRGLQADLVLASGPNEAVLLTYAGPPEIPMIQLFHVYPPVCFARNRCRRVARFVRALRQAAACQVLLPSHRDTLLPYTRVPAAVIGDAVAYPAEEPLPPPDSREKTILCVAHLSADKNQMTLIEAYARLGGTDWQLCLYGTGTPECEAALHRRAEVLGIAHRVRFFGVVHPPRAVLSRAGIFAYPSRGEGFGLALAEAMWCGLPCVGFAGVPGVSELIVHGANGLLAPTPDAGALAAELKRLTEDADLRIRLGITAAKFARANYSAERVTQQWEDLLGETLEKVKKTPQSP